MIGDDANESAANAFAFLSRAAERICARIILSFALNVASFHMLGIFVVYTNTHQSCSVSQLVRSDANTSERGDTFRSALVFAHWLLIHDAVTLFDKFVCMCLCAGQLSVVASSVDTFCNRTLGRV